MQTILGGLGGLFMGVSLISIVEAMFWMAKTFVKFCGIKFKVSKAN